MNCIVVTVEGLGNSILGFMGSSIARTPTIDTMAASGIVLDQCFLDGTVPVEQLRSLWTETHAAQPNQADSSAASIWRRMEGHRDACLITDHPQVAALAESLGCKDSLFVDVRDGYDRPAESFDDCQMMHLFAVAAESLANRDGLVWIHSCGLRHAWDAPLELRSRFVDPEDPPPPAEVGPPNIVMDEATDPDDVVGWGQVAAAQASVFDECLAVLSAAVQSREDHGEWSWTIAGIGGTPLGEHGLVGPRVSDQSACGLFGEELNCPVVVSPSNSWREEYQQFPLVGVRRNELFQLPDLSSTIGSLLGLAVSADTWGMCLLTLPPSDSPHRWLRSLQLAYVHGASHTWIRSPGWSLVIHDEEEPAEKEHALESALNSESGSVRLYVKPEDRWEVNNVVDRRRDIAEQLNQFADHFANAVKSNQRGAWPDLPDELVDLLR